MKKRELFAADGTVREFPYNTVESFGSDYHRVACTGEHVPDKPFPCILIRDIPALNLLIPEFVEGRVQGRKAARTVPNHPYVPAAVVKDENPETSVLPAEPGPGGMDRAECPVVAESEKRAGHRMQSGNIL